MPVLDAVAADWWHSVTVGVLVLALLLETAAAYASHNSSIGSEPGASPVPRWSKRLWVKSYEPKSNHIYNHPPLRFPAFDSHIAAVLRGIARLMLGLMLLARIAAKQPALPAVDLGL